MIFDCVEILLNTAQKEFRELQNMIRKYQNNDFSRCASIVNKVWNFSGKFKPEPLSDLFLEFYTGGSLGASNFAVVIEENHRVKGFLFGKCGNANLIETQYSSFCGQLRFVTRLLFIRHITLKKKMYYLKIIGVHETNRRKIEPDRINEINLFAVDPDSHGKGYGKMLMQSFIEHCWQQNVNRITLDSDEECNTGFYNHFGFKVKGVFDSPLQKEYSGKSGLSIVYELIIN